MQKNWTSRIFIFYSNEFGFLVFVLLNFIFNKSYNQKIKLVISINFEIIVYSIIYNLDKSSFYKGVL